MYYVSGGHCDIVTEGKTMQKTRIATCTAVSHIEATYDEPCFFTPLKNEQQQNPLW